VVGELSLFTCTSAGFQIPGLMLDFFCGERFHYVVENTKKNISSLTTNQDGEAKNFSG
jgi:hypothetical protein